MAALAIAARSAYQQSFDARPYTTLAATNGALSAIGDVVAQASQILLAKPGKHEDAPKYDPQRTLRFLAFGVAMGPIIGRWNKFLEYRFPLRTSSPSKGISNSGARSYRPNAVASARPETSSGVRGVAVMKRVAADQLFMAPIGLMLFLGSMGIMEGRDASQIRQKYRDLFKPAMLANWQVWPLAQIINFRYMPLPYRVPFQSTCGIFWNLYLSLLNSSENQEIERKGAIRRTTNL